MEKDLRISQLKQFILKKNAVLDFKQSNSNPQFKLNEICHLSH